MRVGLSVGSTVLAALRARRCREHVYYLCIALVESGTFRSVSSFGDPPSMRLAVLLPCKCVACSSLALASTLVCNLCMRGTRVDAVALHGAPGYLIVAPAQWPGYTSPNAHSSSTALMHHTGPTADL